jgi:hypothetical protein
MRELPYSLEHCVTRVYSRGSRNQIFRRIRTSVANRDGISWQKLGLEYIPVTPGCVTRVYSRGSRNQIFHRIRTSVADRDGQSWQIADLLTVRWNPSSRHRSFNCNHFVFVPGPLCHVLLCHPHYFFFFFFWSPVLIFFFSKFFFLKNNF